ncbi:MAG: SDR family oxidoreductase [Deltaproteobacteria bacterium]|nr:SDR family oxidoreductase [Deltaproteobacteria bacterium]
MTTRDKWPASVIPTPLRDGLFQDRVVLITGGGTGIGRAMALEFAALGARIATCGRRAEPIDALGEELRTRGHTEFHAPCDIRDADAVNAYVDAVVGKLGGIDVLVNNAGGQFPAPAVSMTPKGFDTVVRNNLVGTFNVTHAVGTRVMVPRRRGRIINIIANIFRGFPGMVHTGAARAGVENMTKTLAVEWAPHNIQVNAIAPGTIVSTGTDRYPPELMDKAENETPARRLGAPEEVSHLACFLASDAADYITGTTIYIDGAASLWGNIWEI